MLHAFAAAKINLTLRVLGRRADGYHRLSSLVAFADVGDRLTLEPSGDLALVVEGPGAAQIGDGAENLVLRAARALAERVPGLMTGTFRLDKRLPIASGIGGGSADAAAALRLLARANGLTTDDPRVVAAAVATGADVPVCLAGRMCVMEGIGEALGPALVRDRLPAVLVNPGVPVETRAVFTALDLAPGEDHRSEPPPCLDTDDLVAALAASGNDLEPPARGLAPQIDAVLDALRTSDACRLARMSGSGATCFGLYPEVASARAAAEALAGARPGWWVVATTLGTAPADQDGAPTVRSAPINAPSTASP